MWRQHILSTFCYCLLLLEGLLWTAWRYVVCFFVHVPNCVYNIVLGSACVSLGLDKYSFVIYVLIAAKACNCNVYCYFEIFITYLCRRIVWISYARYILTMPIKKFREDSINYSKNTFSQKSVLLGKIWLHDNLCFIIDITACGLCGSSSPFLSPLSFASNSLYEQQFVSYNIYVSCI